MIHVFPAGAAILKSGLHSGRVESLIVAVLLFVATQPLARRLSVRERDPRLYRIVMISVALHLIAAPTQIYVVNHYYHGITDFTRYVNQGAILAPRFRTFNFSLAGTNQKFLGAGSISVFTGVVMAIVGTNKLAAFLVFGWLAFVGTLGFYRAFAITFPEADHHRYALMIFFLPSLIFWTAGASKEAVMYLSIGTASDGAARILARQPRGVLLMVLGVAVGIYVRPQELLLLLAVVSAASFFRPRGARRGSMRMVRFVAMAGAEAVLLVFVVAFTQKLAKQGTPVFSLNTIAANNAGEASSIAYHAGPAGYPHDLYAVLFAPMIFHTHGAGQRVAALENTVIILLILTSLRRIRCLPRAAMMRPYVMVAFLDLAGFCYAFAALSNLGLIDRERVLVLPFLLVLLAIPVTKKGRPKQYPWEMSKRRRRERLQPGPAWARVPVGPAPR